MQQYNARACLRRAAILIGFFIPLFVVAQAPIWKNSAFALYADSVTQQGHTSHAISRTEIWSNYRSPVNEFKSGLVDFKFSINGRDNEMPSGTDHHFIIPANVLNSETPLIEFGVPLKVNKKQSPGFLKPGTRWKIRLDMRKVLAAFRDKGYYTAFDGTRIYQEDFKAVYVAGSSAPLIWDFDNLVHHAELELKDPDGDGVYELELEMNRASDERVTSQHWKLSQDISAYPQTQSPYPMADALYQLSLEEMLNAVEPDSTLRTGREWAGVWTRDVSYSILLSMAYLQPRAAQLSLWRKVDRKKKIIQDTGTGGAWPVSSDRMIWAVAAWELYKVTGDQDWLRQAYEVVNRSIRADMEVLYDAATGLVRGESSFLDWREQTYPSWMQPVDIFHSINLGTNAVHYQANRVAASMAQLLNDQDGQRIFSNNADKIRQGMNQYLWLPEKNAYAQYLYGRSFPIVSDRQEALGSALAVLFGIASEDQAQALVKSMPVTPFGITCISPQIPDIPPYHNNGVWPFVQAYWLWAAAANGSDQEVMQSIAMIWRPAALFLTNKENFVAENGDYAGTQINSSNMLWSLSGNISVVHRILFGIQFDQNRLLFRPLVPAALRGTRHLRGFRYRQAILDITVEGSGRQVGRFELDGRPVEAFEFPASIAGRHQIHIWMTDGPSGPPPSSAQPVSFTPATPLLQQRSDRIQWQPVPRAVKYRVWENGRELFQTTTTHFVLKGNGYREYQVQAIDRQGLSSFASEPLPIVDTAAISSLEFETILPASTRTALGFLGTGFIETSIGIHDTISFPLACRRAGRYLLRIRYANGNGPVNTDNKCAVRSIRVNGQQQGALVFPQRGKDEWSDWGWTSILLHLPEGVSSIQLLYQAANENMSIDINQALLDRAEWIWLSPQP